MSTSTERPVSVSTAGICACAWISAFGFSPPYIDMLAEVKESIINAYVLKTGLSRPKLSHLMDAETWESIL